MVSWPKVVVFQRRGLRDNNKDLCVGKTHRGLILFAPRPRGRRRSSERGSRSGCILAASRHRGRDRAS